MIQTWPAQNPRLLVHHIQNKNLMNEQSKSIRIADRDENSRVILFCVRAMCEHEFGWHPCRESIEYKSLSKIPQPHYAYFYRIMSLIKIMPLNLDVLGSAEILEKLLNYIDEHLPNSSPDDNYI